jgi:tetratricopeptide (TPR) repeat protein
MGAEEHYLDAVEAYDEGDLEAAYAAAKLAVKEDSKHVDAWQLCAEAALPKKGESPTLKQVALSLAAVKKIIALEPERTAMWFLGGRLLSDELGLLYDALDWWQQLRHHLPNEVTPLVEQATLLADMGLYTEARYRLEAITEENMDVSGQQYAKIQQLHSMVMSASMQDQAEFFKPWERHHNGWGAIETKMRKPPVSESFLFMATTVPVLLLEVLFSNRFVEQGWGGFCLTTLLIFGTVLFGMRFSRRIFRRVNRPAFNLLRAMNFEASSGYVVISEEIRTSVLYVYIMQRKPKAWQERMLKIIDDKTKLPGGWKQTLPDFESHFDEIGYIEEASDEQFESFEEE